MYILEALLGLNLLTSGTAIALAVRRQKQTPPVPLAPAEVTCLKCQCQVVRHYKQGEDYICENCHQSALEQKLRK